MTTQRDSRWLHLSAPDLRGLATRLSELADLLQAALPSAETREQRLQELAMELDSLRADLEAMPPTACPRCISDALEALRRAIRSSCLGPE